jgi:hypothetical protein
LRVGFFCFGTAGAGTYGEWSVNRGVTLFERLLPVFERFLVKIKRFSSRIRRIISEIKRLSFKIQRFRAAAAQIHETITTSFTCSAEKNDAKHIRMTNFLKIRIIFHPEWRIFGKRNESINS